MKTSQAYRINTLRINVTDGPKAKNNSNKTFTVHHIEIVERGGELEVTIGGQQDSKLIYLTKTYYNSEIAEGEMPEWLSDLVGKELARLEPEAAKLAKVAELLTQLDRSAEVFSGKQDDWMAGSVYATKIVANDLRKILDA